MNNIFEITFLGTGGSCGYNNGKRAKYGTNTPCAAVRVGDNPRHTLVFDAGNGICGLSALPLYDNETVRLFLTHYHADHIRGLLFWDVFFDAGKRIQITGIRTIHGGVRETLDHYLRGPFYPAGLAAAKADISFSDAACGAAFLLEGGVTVRTVGLSHPDGGLGYRVDFEGKSMCYITDVALDNHRDNTLADFVRGTDLLINDAFFGTGECIKGWGHSSVYECAKLARDANAKRLALYHYKHTYTDDDIDEMEAVAKREFPCAFAPTDGLVISL
ncbi:MAG: MBL fold metallo-hydrolase [Defluviitaleaceae bacterium]|nr:MBL fold metallo-hydrolase [Defluviitaleaceae bacterium]